MTDEPTPDTALLPAPPEAPPAMPTDLDEGRLSKLAKEVAIDMQPLEVLLVRFKLTAAQYAIIIESPYFRRVHDQMKIEWEAATNTAERNRLKAALLFEENLPVLGGRMADTKESFAAAVEAGKLLAKVGKLDTPEQGARSGEKFTINISVSPDKKITFEKTIDAVPASSPSDEPADLLQESSGVRDGKEVLNLSPVQDSET